MRPGAKRVEIEGDLRLDHVTFAYGAEPVLHAIDLHVPAGGCLALVGESGGGKSTTAKLVGRFYDPDDGAIRVDGHDLRDLELRAYRRQLGVVLQDPFLFAGTIADNIRFAHPEATDAEVEDVARAVGVDNGSRARFDDGSAPRGARGRRRPVGRRAAADLDRPRPARRPAHPDPRRGDVEHRPADRDPDRARARPACCDGRTSIIIAHRLATVRRADEILVVEHGRIAQRGRFDELLAADGPFRRLARDLEGAPYSPQSVDAEPASGSRASSWASVSSSDSE